MGPNLIQPGFPSGPGIYAPMLEINIAASTFTLPTGSQTVIVYLPYYLPAPQVTITSIRHWALTNFTGSGTKRVSYAFYRAEWAANTGFDANTRGRWLPKGKLYEETLNVITGGTPKLGGLQFTLASPFRDSASMADPFGRLRYLGVKFEQGFTAGTARGAPTRSMLAQAHVLSEVGAFDSLPFVDTPTGTYVDSGNSVTVSGSGVVVDNLAIATWMDWV